MYEFKKNILQENPANDDAVNHLLIDIYMRYTSYVYIYLSI